MHVASKENQRLKIWPRWGSRGDGGYCSRKDTYKNFKTMEKARRSQLCGDCVKKKLVVVVKGIDA